jgi:hypothetical protein
MLPVAVDGVVVVGGVAVLRLVPAVMRVHGGWGWCLFGNLGGSGGRHGSVPGVRVAGVVGAAAVAGMDGVAAVPGVAGMPGVTRVV